MRKKSHVSLASYLVNNINTKGLRKYKKSFYIGSILPDLKPSFLVREHTIDKTFYILTEEIKKVTLDYDPSKGMNKRFAKRLGVITHYLADYFTFPHNSIFQGSYKEHFDYEKDLKFVFRSYVKKDEVQQTKTDKPKKNLNFDEIIQLIKDKHYDYLQAESSATRDSHYIINLCYEIIYSIIMFLEYNFLQITNKSEIIPALSSN